MKKKLISMMLCAALAATMMVGCGKKEEAAAPKRRVGRPRKDEVANQNAELLKQLGKSLMNISTEPTSAKRKKK